MKRKLTTILLIAIFAIIGANAQTLEQLFEKANKYAGNHDEMKTLKIQAKMNMMNMDIPFLIYNKKPSMKRTEMEVMGSKMIQGDDGTKGWMINPMAGSSEPQEIPAEQYKAMKGQNDYNKSPLESLKENGYTPTLEGKETIEGKECFKIKMTHKELPETFMFIDASDYSLYVMRVKSEQGDVDQIFSDYKMVSGVKMPHKIDIKGGMMTGFIIFEKVEVNIPLDDSLFKMPGK